MHMYLFWSASSNIKWVTFSRDAQTIHYHLFMAHVLWVIGDNNVWGIRKNQFEGKSISILWKMYECIIGILLRLLLALIKFIDLEE